MKNFQYEKYDYSFLYGLLTEKQRKEVEDILNLFVGRPNNEITRTAVEMALNKWLCENNINIKGKLKVEYE